MLNVNFSPFPNLSTERLNLRRMTLDDANESFFLRSDERVMKYIDRPRAQSLDDILLFVQKVDKMIDNNEGVSWAITLKNDPKLIGHISFHRLMKEHFRAEVGYVMHPDYQGKGLAHEALEKVLHYGFLTMGLHSVEANVNPANAASMKLLERSNFVREAYHKENFYWQGKFLDSVIYSLINPFQ